MCVVSMIFDHYRDKWGNAPYWPPPPPPSVWPLVVPVAPPISAEEIAEFKRLLDRAREYDKKHHQPDCELAEKQRQVRELAERLGVRIDFLEEGNTPSQHGNDK